MMSVGIHRVLKRSMVFILSFVSSLAVLLCLFGCAQVSDDALSGSHSKDDAGEIQTPTDPSMLSTFANATKDQPKIKELSTWDKSAKDIMKTLESHYKKDGMKLTAREGYPYFLAVNRAANTLTVYAIDSQNKYTKPFLAMVCSTGKNTPLGYFTTPAAFSWGVLYGPCYGQYVTRIKDDILFHSVPYYTQHKDDLEYDEFNLLGTTASLGCVRLSVADVKWIYDNCPVGTPVVIYDDKDNPGPMGKPGTIYIDPQNEKMRGWDPTDPDPKNPWPDTFETGTAIRSKEAYEQWKKEHESWLSTLTPTDLQGWSTDSKIEGTRG